MPAVKKPDPQPSEPEKKQDSPVSMKAEVVEDDAPETPVVKPSSVNPPPELPKPAAPSTPQAPPTPPNPTPAPGMGTQPIAGQTPPPTPVSPPVTPTPSPSVTQTGAQVNQQIPNLSQIGANKSLMDTPNQAGGAQPPSGGDGNTRGVNYDSSMGGLDSTVPLEKKNRKMFAIGIVLLVIVLAGLAFVLYQRSQLPPVSTGDETVEVQPGEVVEENTPTPTPTPEPGLERSEITVEVLNGSGVTGAAGEFADILEDLGYEVGEVGNAIATTGNELYVQEDLEDELGVLLEDMADELGITKVTGYLEDSEATARVILGADEEEDASASSAQDEEEATDSATTE